MDDVDSMSKASNRCRFDIDFIIISDWINIRIFTTNMLQYVADRFFYAFDVLYDITTKIEVI